MCKLSLQSTADRMSLRCRSGLEAFSHRASAKECTCVLQFLSVCVVLQPRHSQEVIMRPPVEGCPSFPWLGLNMPSKISNSEVGKWVASLPLSAHKKEEK